MQKQEFQQYKQQVNAWIAKYCPGVKVEYSKRMVGVHGSSFGKRKLIRLSLHALAQGSVLDSQDTILHEIAHILAPTHHHDLIWRHKFKTLCEAENLPWDDARDVRYANFAVNRFKGYDVLFQDSPKPQSQHTPHHYWWECVVCSWLSTSRTTQPNNPPYKCYRCERLVAPDSTDQYQDEVPEGVIADLRARDRTVLLLRSTKY